MVVLDLFCGAGGASMGYHNAGFEVVGIDIEPQPHYPFTFIQDDALSIRNYASWWWFKIDFIHASPPCQKFSMLNQVLKKDHPDLIGQTRELLKSTNLPYVIENVPQSPLIDPIQLCGGYFGLGIQGYYLKRHRWFESNVPLVGTPCNHFEKYAIGVYGHGPWNNNDKDKPRGGYQGNAAEKAEAMGIDWMNRNELSQAIPPAYTEYIGKQIIDSLS